MIHTYDITGMTCGGCKASVEKYLGNLDNVTNVSVNLDKAEVEVAMSSKVPIEALKKALPEKYLLSEKDDKNDFQMASLSRDEIKQKSKLQQLQPLLIIFLGLTQHQAQGTALFAMLPPIGILAAVNYYRQGFVKWEYAIVIAFTFVIGGYLGSKLSLSLPPQMVRRIFGVIMLLGAIKLISSK